MKRLIPVLLLKNGLIVRSQFFRVHQSIGNPMHTVRRLSNWNVDELILLDISTEDHHDLRRDDLQVQYQASNLLGLLPEIAKLCFMPLAVGGGIRSIEAMHDRFSAGADKCVVNSEAVRNPALLTQASRAFGAQAIVASIDVLRHPDGRAEVMIDGGKTPTTLDPVAWARECEQRGAGEIMLNSVDRDGAGNGYDLEMVQAVTSVVSIPVIACGGVGTYADFAPALPKGGRQRSGSCQHFSLLRACLSPRQTHMHRCRHLHASCAIGQQMVCTRTAIRLSNRKIQTGCATAQRPSRLFHRRSRHARTQNALVHPVPLSVTQCATPMEYDANGLCTGCQMANMKTDFSAAEWQRRDAILRGFFERARSSDGRHDLCDWRFGRQR